MNQHQQQSQQLELKASPIIPEFDNMSSITTSLRFDPVVEIPEKVQDNHASSIEESPSSGVVEKQMPNRCMTCQKQVGLTWFKRRCGGMFCSVHQYSEQHKCFFDCKSIGRDAIAKANPAVKAENIVKFDGTFMIKLPD